MPFESIQFKYQDAFLDTKFLVCEKHDRRRRLGIELLVHGIDAMCSRSAQQKRETSINFPISKYTKVPVIKFFFNDLFFTINKQYDPAIHLSISQKESVSQVLLLLFLTVIWGHISGLSCFYFIYLRCSFIPFDSIGKYIFSNKGK